MSKQLQADRVGPPGGVTATRWRRNRRDDLNNPRSYRSGQLFEVQLGRGIRRRVQLNAAFPVLYRAIPLHWRHRLLILQTTNHSRDIPADPEIYTNAAIYPDAIALAAAILNPGHSRIIKQTPSADTLD